MLITDQNKIPCIPLSAMMRPGNTKRLILPDDNVHPCFNIGSYAKFNLMLPENAEITF